ncbi:MAG: hypothetical protein JXQ83_10770 [Candidatus Glassbacteria bacterium]|nr:hypothetical protein [Candidatus Glassbacteria bacterium]
MNSGRLTYVIVFATILCLAGCSTKPSYYVELTLPGDLSCSGIEIMLLSYDYDGVLDSLAQINNPGPRPDSTELMTLLDEYRNALTRQTRYADSVSSLHERLEKMDVKSIEYKKLYPLFQALEKALQKVSAEQKSTYERYMSTRASYNTMLNEWRQSAYQGFDEFKENIPPERKTKIETTGNDCMVKKLNLPLGDWWLHSEITIPGTNQKLVWDMMLPATGPDSLHILLDESNAERELFFI